MDTWDIMLGTLPAFAIIMASMMLGFRQTGILIKALHDATNKRVDEHNGRIMRTDERVDKVMEAQIRERDGTND